MKRWSMENGYKDVLRLGLPLVVSMASTTVMQFTDRVFLGRYSLETIAAATPASLASFLFMSFFMGVAGYVNVFVAQYHGSKAPDRVGASLWQGIYFCLAAGLVMAALSFIADPLFDLAGHPPEVRRLESSYFVILNLGSGLGILAIGMSTFYSGRGLTRTVMIANMLGAGVNIPLDYALIFGAWGFPEMGIRGAGLATVAGWAVTALFFALIIFTRANDKVYGVRKKRGFDRELFGRMMRYGLPGGIQFFIDIFAFSFFIFMVGRLGKQELAATNIAFAINTLSFMPLIGFHIAVETMVGQAVGMSRPDLGEEATKSALHIALAYTFFIGAVFVLAPGPLLSIFKPQDIGLSEFAAITAYGVILLRFIAVYCVFDALVIIFFGAIRGAGDTMFAMKASGGLSLCIMIIPVFIAVEYLGASLVTLWYFITLFVMTLGLVAWLRFKGGKWKEMSVIREMGS